MGVTNIKKGELQRRNTYKVISFCLGKMKETKQKSWFGRHPIIRICLGLLLLFIAISWFWSTTAYWIGLRSPNEQKTQTDSVQSPIDSKSWHDITNFSGKGNKNTDSFFIEGDKVKITARTWGARFGSFSGVDLERDDGAYIGTGLSISAQGSEEGNGETIYRNLKSGNYFISVISGIDWEVDVDEYTTP